MLGELLVRQGHISNDELTIALEEQSRTGQKLGRLLVRFGFVSEKRLRISLGKIKGVRSVDLTKVAPDQLALECLPKDVAIRLGVVPLRFCKKSSTLLVATSEPDDLVLLDQVRHLSGNGCGVKSVVATESEIARALEAVYESSSSLDNALEFAEEERKQGANESAVHDIVRLVEEILADAVRRGSSDVHLEPEFGYIRIRYRIDGVLRHVRSLHSKYWPAMVGRLKVQAGLDIAESRRPQDGGFTLSLMGKPVDFRLSTFPVMHGENIVLRVLDRNKTVLSLDAMNQAPEIVASMKNILMKPDGIVLVAGPTGSGKTSTLYAMVNALNSESVNIMTLEDPVEYPLEMVRQSSIGQQKALSFHDGIRAILRQDPDIVLIGEIRDAETAQIAMRAAMTGHKVLSTIHTRSSIAAVQRLVNLDVELTTLVENLSAVVSQRLIRLSCKTCGGGEHADTGKCSDCDTTGYHGRQAVMEVLSLNESLAELLIGAAGPEQIRNHARDHGWIPMSESAWQMQAEGLTDTAEVERVFGLREVSG